MIVSGGRFATPSIWRRLLFITLFCAMPLSAGSGYSATEQEALRVLSKHKALFTLIPQRVAQILKMVRLHAHATPAQRLEIVHGAREHVDGKRRIVLQLRDTISSVGTQLSPHLREMIQKRFTALDKRLTDYVGTLNTTYKVLDDEQNKLIVAAGASPENYKTGKAYQAAQAVLAPNHIDTLVDTLAGHDRATSAHDSPQVSALTSEVKQLRQEVAQARNTSPPILLVETDDDQELAAQVSQLQQEVAAIGGQANEQAAALMQKDFAQAMADMSYMHTQALADQEKDHKRQVQKLKKKVKKEKKKQAATTQEEGVMADLRTELGDDLKVVGRGFLRVYRGIKNGIRNAATTAYKVTKDGIVALRDRVVSGTKAAHQPVMMSGIALGGQLAPAGAWSAAGKLRTASLLDTARVVEQPLLPATIKESYDHARDVSAQTIANLWQQTRRGLTDLKDKAGSLIGATGSILKKTVHTGAQGIGGVTIGAGSAAYRGVSGVAQSVANGAKSGIKKVADSTANALESARLAACRIGARTCAIGAVTYRHATGAVHSVGAAASKGAHALSNGARSVHQHVSVDAVTQKIYGMIGAVGRSLRSGLDSIASISRHTMQGVTDIFEWSTGLVGSMVVTVWNAVGVMADTVRAIATQWYHAAHAAMINVHDRVQPGKLIARGTAQIKHGAMCARNVAGQCMKVFAQSANEATDLVQGGAYNMKAAVTRGAHRVAHAARHGFDHAREKIYSVGNRGLSGVRAATDSIQAGVTYGRSALGAAAAQVGQAASSAAHSVQGGAHVVQHGLGSTVATLRDGVTRGAQMVGSSASSLLSTAQRGMHAVTGAVRHGMVNGSGVIAQGARQAAQKVSQGVGAAQQFTFTLGDAVAHYWRAFTGMIATLFDGMKRAVISMKNVMTTHGSAATRSFVGTTRSVGARLTQSGQQGFARLRQTGANTLRATRAAVNNSMYATGVAVGGALDRTRAAFGTLGSAAQGAASAVTGGLQQAYNGTTHAASGAMQAIKTGSQKIYNGATNATRSAGTLLHGTLHDVSAVAQRAGRAAYNGTAHVAGGVQTALHSAQGMARNAVHGVGAMGGQTVSQVADLTRRGVNTARGTVTVASQSLWSWSKRTVSSLGAVTVTLKKEFHRFLAQTNDLMHRAAQRVVALAQDAITALVRAGQTVSVQAQGFFTKLKGTITSFWTSGPPQNVVG